MYKWKDYGPNNWVKDDFMEKCSNWLIYKPLKEENMEDYLKDEKKVQAIKDSVEVWEKKKRGKKGDPCPLCVLFHEERDERCENCPLYIRGLYCNLPGSPYNNWDNDRTPENAQNMVLALKSLFFPEEKKKEVFYHIGQRFVGEDYEYILCRCDMNGKSLVQLTNIKTGGRWSGPEEVNSHSKITEKEFDELGGSGTFKLKEEK